MREVLEAFEGLAALPLVERALHLTDLFIRFSQKFTPEFIKFVIYHRLTEWNADARGMPHAADNMAPMPNALRVTRAAFDISDPWQVPEGAAWASLLRSTDGRAPRLATRVAATWDQAALTFLFSGSDDLVVATHRDHDAPLYEEDVVEVFLAPLATTQYFEIEVNPLGTTFDARITSPSGVRATMTAELGWTCERLFAAIARTKIADGPDAQVLTVIRIPFASLGVGVPATGEEWRGNLFRIDRHPSGDEFSAWRPTFRVPADFHVAAAFGVMRFE